MKILMTGMTALQVNSPHRPIQKIDVPAAFVDGLRLFGHEVDWRKVELGEEIDRYDVVFVSLSLLQSFGGARAGMGALYTIGKALAGDIPMVLFYDDWKIDATHAQIKFTTANVEKQFYKKIGGKPFFGGVDLKEVKKYEPIMRAALEYLDADEWGGRSVVLTPMYRWGNRESVTQHMRVPAKRFHAIDPTPAVIDLDEFRRRPKVHKLRRWFCASLSDQSRWSSEATARWPIDYVGAKQIGAERLKTEEDVIKMYYRHFGALSPPYLHAGSGWFRSRYVYSAMTNSVLLAGLADVSVLGPAFEPRGPEIEEMDDGALRRLASKQRAVIQKHLTSHAQFITKIHDVVRAPTRLRSSYNVSIGSRPVARKKEPSMSVRTRTNDVLSYHFAQHYVRPSSRVLELLAPRSVSGLVDTLFSYPRRTPREYVGAGLKVKAQNPEYSWAKFVDADPTSRGSGEYTEIFALDLFAGSNAATGRKIIRAIADRLATSGRAFLFVRHDTWRPEALVKALAKYDLAPEARYGIGSTDQVVMAASERFAFKQLTEFYGKSLAGKILAPLFPDETDVSLWVVSHGGDNGEVAERVEPEDVPPVQKKTPERTRSATSPTRAPRRGSGLRMREMIGEGKRSEEILKAIHSEFPESKAGRSDVYYNWNKMFKAGETKRPWADVK